MFALYVSFVSFNCLVVLVVTVSFSPCIWFFAGSSVREGGASEVEENCLTLERIPWPVEGIVGHRQEKHMC